MHGYEVTTIGDVAASSSSSSSGPTLGARALSLVTDVRAQKVGLVVGLLVGVAGALLVVRLRGRS